MVVRTTEGRINLRPIRYHDYHDVSSDFEDEGSSTDTYLIIYDIDTSKHAKNQVKIYIHYVAEGTIGVYNLTNTLQSDLGRLNDIVADPELTLMFGSIKADLRDNELSFYADLHDKFSFDAEGVEIFAIIVRTWRPFLSESPFFLCGATLVWSDDIVEQRTVTKERQVPYQVPFEVEKQRTVIKIKKVPIWEALLTEETPSTTPAAPPTSPEPVSTNTTLEAEPTVPTVPPSNLLYEDDFSDPKSGAVEQSSAQGESYYKDGEFHGVLNMRDWSSWQYRRNAGRFKDFIIEEDIRLVSGPKDSSYGLIFRCQDDDNFYRFLVSADGSYVVGARLDGKWVDMPRWMMSEYVEKGYSTNHLKVVCKGDQIEVYVNGHYLTAVVDDSFADGYIGGIISTVEPGAHVVFDNLKVYSLVPETP